VGLITFDEDVVDYIPPSARNLDLCLHALHRADAKGPGDLRSPLLKAIESLRRKGILVLISDFYHDTDEVLEAVRLLQSPGHDVMVFHVLDPAELEFPFEGASNFRDMESGDEFPLVPNRVREGYLEQLRAHQEVLKDKFTAARVDYAVLDTSKPLDQALFRFLLHREKRSRVR
jgi:uncharacterized protein (DUF58 family)